MKAVMFDNYGGPEVLALREVPEPAPGPGQVRIAVRAAGVNGIDWKIRQGFMRDVRPRPLPSGTGLDAAGVVDALGDGVADVALGDRVFGSGEATYAEAAVLSAWATMPDGLSFEEAAGLPVPVETAIRVLALSGIQPGETLLVSGASGGVGSALVQIARARGVQVIGTASARNQAYLADLGATPATYGEGWVERVRALAPGGVDAAIDVAGSGVIPDLVALTGDASRVVSIADFTAGEHGAKVSTRAGDRAAAFAEAARLVAAGRLRMAVERTFPLERAGEAQAASAQGHAAGRIVLTVP